MEFENKMILIRDGRLLLIYVALNIGCFISIRT